MGPGAAKKGGFFASSVVPKQAPGFCRPCQFTFASEVLEGVLWRELLHRSARQFVRIGASQGAWNNFTVHFDRGRKPHPKSRNTKAKHRVCTNSFEKFARTFLCFPVTWVRNRARIDQKTLFRCTFLFWVNSSGGFSSSDLRSWHGFIQEFHGEFGGGHLFATSPMRVRDSSQNLLERSGP